MNWIRYYDTGLGALATMILMNTQTVLFSVVSLTFIFIFWMLGDYMFNQEEEKEDE